MILIGFLLLHLIVSSCCSNITGKYMSMDERSLHNNRGRLITFHTEDEDIMVGIEFAVPFIKIPVKKSLDITKGALANVNLGAVLLTGTMAVAVALIIPTMSTFFNKKLFMPLGSGYEFTTNSYGSYRNSNPSEVWRYLTILDDILMEHNIDTTSCMQKLICRTIKKSSKKVSNGKGTSIDKILDGLATNDWVQGSISDTPFYSALKNGLNYSNCSEQYDRCKLTQRAANTFVKSFIKAINGDY